MCCAVLRCAVLMRMLLFNILFSKYSRFNLKFLAIPHEPLSATNSHRETFAYAVPCSGLN